MSWRCADCGRTHDDPPETCACGSPDIQPIDGDASGTDIGDDRFSLVAVRRRLLDPAEADRSLVRDDPRVAFVFRALVLVSLVVLFVVAVVLLV